MRRGSLFNHFLILLLVVIILPIVLAYSFVSSIFIEQLHSNYNETVRLSAYIAAQSIKEAIGNVIDMSVSIIGDDKVRDFLLNQNAEENLSRYNSARSILENYYLGNSYITNIYIASVEGDKTISTSSVGSYEFTEGEKERMLASRGAWFWSRQPNGGMAVCRLIRNVDNNKEKLGFIKIIIDEDNLEKQFYAAETETEFTYAIADINDEFIVLTTNEEDTENILQLLEEKKEEEGNSREYIIQNNNQYSIYKQIAINTRSSYLVVVAEDQAFYYKRMKGYVITFMLFLFVIFWGLWAVLYRKDIAMPLAMLERQMKQLKPDSGAPDQVSIEAKGEIKELVTSFNMMAVKLDHLYETNYKNELRLRDINLLILQSEINPHFLYNVLDSIRWMIELKENEAASSMVQNLSEMFRLTLSQAEKNTVSLGQELEHLKKYIVLMRYRFGDKIRFGINIQENLDNPMTVKFVLQPLVENSIVHGFAQTNGYGNIIISVYASDNQLIFDVRDDGCGADPDRIEEILGQKLKKENSLEGFALENIQARLRLRYGEKYGIIYKRKEEGGSIFIVKQPLIYEKGREEC